MLVADGIAEPPEAILNQISRWKFSAVPGSAAP